MTTIYAHKVYNSLATCLGFPPGYPHQGEAAPDLNSESPSILVQHHGRLRATVPSQRNKAAPDLNSESPSILAQHPGRLRATVPTRRPAPLQAWVGRQVGPTLLT
ncbi:unnamed protein product [Lupinus luteus]|uniref:Uncharacterized protein n=1 Tax=Lupinus luteus TaxID=3873 RepID=A0AAV1XRM6_LUPLU